MSEPRLQRFCPLCPGLGTRQAQGRKLDGDFKKSNALLVLVACWNQLLSECKFLAFVAEICSEP